MVERSAVNRLVVGSNPTWGVYCNILNFCFALLCVALQKCIWCRNAVFGVFCAARFLTFCFAEDFPLENVMLNILQRKMWCWRFSFGKCDAKMHFCTAEHFPKENVRWTFSFGKCTPKCILASNAFVTFCVTKCTHQMHFAAF